jgi:hydrogenase maturation protease
MAHLFTLIVGYGNPDRQDDGLAWHILAKLARLFNIEGIDPDSEDFFPVGNNPDLLFTLQLTPELAETISRYERVCFIDAHTGEIGEDVSFHEIAPEFKSSPLTHHMTPQTLLSLVVTLYQRNPGAVLISVRGSTFGFTRSLSEKASQLVPTAVEKIITWFHSSG